MAQRFDSADGGQITDRDVRIGSQIDFWQAQRLRLGVTLILAIVFADAMTVAAKGAFSSPRPDAVDARVRTFGAFESGLPPMATGTSVPADDFGFPPDTWQRPRHGPWASPGLIGNRGSSALQPHGSR
jgi:hypothetical protein